MQQLEALAAPLGVSPMVLVALLGVVTLFASRLMANLFRGNRPPIHEGIPFVGGLIKFAKGPYPLMEEGYNEHGEVFTVPVAHKRVTFLIGPDVSPHFFKASDEEMSQSEVYGYSVPTFGKGVVFDVDQKVRNEQFRFFTLALSKERLKGYVPLFVMEAEQYFAKWGDSGEVDLGKEFSKLVCLTAARTLLGREMREQMFDGLTRLLRDLDEGMMPISVFAPYLPIPAHKRRDRAREELGRMFAKVIQERRASGRKEVDVLQQFIDARYQNVLGGRQLTEDEIAGLLLAVLFAGQHTSSITSAWTGYFMIANKDKCFKAAQEEQRRVLKEFGPELELDLLDKSLPVLHRCITEALRMRPPLIMLLRYAKNDFNVTDSKGQTFVVPKGDIVATSPSFSHMLPGVFKNPTQYDPDRFAEPREEDKVKPFSFIGFGGGRHGCIGSNFGYLQMKAIWSVLLRNFDFEPLDPVPEPDYESMVIGPKAARVRFTRKKLQY